MIQAKIRKQGNSYVVTIPKDEMERRQLHEGDVVSFHPVMMETRAVLSPELQEIVDRISEEHREALEYLADH